MHKRREGFTLIELLIVIVIIGILAAIAIPKFGATREKAYYKAMQSDLRNVAAQQEIYYSDPANTYTYATASGDYLTPGDLETLLGITPSQGVTIDIAGATGGWAAVATHAALTGGTNQACWLFSGDQTDVAALTPAVPTEAQPGVVYCDET